MSAKDAVTALDVVAQDYAMSKFFSHADQRAAMMEEIALLRAASTAKEAEVKRLRDALQDATEYLHQRVVNTGGLGETWLMPRLLAALKDTQ
jgi:cell division protein FtsB